MAHQHKAKGQRKEYQKRHPERVKKTQDRQELRKTRREALKK